MFQIIEQPQNDKNIKVNDTLIDCGTKENADAIMALQLHMSFLRGYVTGMLLREYDSNLSAMDRENLSHILGLTEK